MILYEGVVFTGYDSDFEWQFNVNEYHVLHEKQNDKDVIQLRPVALMNHNLTKTISDTLLLDKEIIVNNDLRVFYSLDQAKVVVWVSNLYAQTKLLLKIQQLKFEDSNLARNNIKSLKLTRDIDKVSDNKKVTPKKIRRDKH